ncbi:unnamed protein product [Heterobilharzia americana]|nr:unnamed protein product [Heterobilharzia americana]
MEIGLLNQLCSLPIHIACPHVISSIRNEAKQLISGLTLHQKDIQVPYNLVTYLFYQLVGEIGFCKNSAPSESVYFTPSTNQVTESTMRNIITAALENVVISPLLSTGIVLGGSGLPLVMKIYNLNNELNGSLESGRVDHAINVRVTADAEIGLQSTLSILGVKSCVPEKLFTYFIEGQRGLADCLSVYLFRVYRDDITKLDQILIRLLDRYYNPHFKSPPLWACLNLGSDELMNFKSSTAGYSSVPEVVMTESESKSSAFQNSYIPVATSNVSSESNIASSSLNTTVSSCNNFEEIATNVCDNQHGSSPTTLPNNKDQDEFPGSIDKVTPHICDDQCSNVDIPDSLNVDDKSSIKHKQSTSVNNLSSVDPVSVSEDTDTLSDSKLDNLRCAVLCDPRRKLRHSATIDTSAPETTSSDNSPAAIRRLILVGKKSSTAHTTESSDGGCGAIADHYKQISTTTSHSPKGCTSESVSVTVVPSSSETKNNVQPDDDKSVSISAGSIMKPSRSPFSSFSDDDECNPTQIPDTNQLNNNNGDDNSFQTNFVEDMLDRVHIHSSSHPHTRNPSKSDNATPRNPVFYSLPVRNPFTTIGSYRLRIGWHSHLKRPPPQPLSDSMAFHVFQLAKTIRVWAGGSSDNGSLFITGSDRNVTVHRNLQLISFQLGLYGLGLFNGLLPSWRNRTFSRNGLWISQQVFEIGVPAAGILYHSWQHHLTASELSAISYQLSKEDNRSLVDVAAELCLASLSLSNALRPQEIRRALEQCGEHSCLTLERGLLCIERSMSQSSYGSLPEIYISLAKSWFTLHLCVAMEYKKVLVSSEPDPVNQQLLSEVVREGHSTNMAFTDTILSKTNVSFNNSTIPVHELSEINDCNDQSHVNNNSHIEPSLSRNSAQMNSNKNPSSSDLANVWNYYQSVNLPQPPVLLGDEKQQQPFMYPSPLLPMNPNYRGFPIGQQEPTHFPYYLGIPNFQQTQPQSQTQSLPPQQTNNSRNANHSQQQLQPIHQQLLQRVPLYLPQPHLISPIQPIGSYPFGISSMPQVTPLTDNPASVPSSVNYYVHPQFISNASLPTPMSSQSINIIPGSSFDTLPHQINPSTALSPNVANSILPCSSYQSYSIDQTIEPSLYCFNPTMAISNIHPSLVCNVTGNLSQQQQRQEAIESVTSSSSSTNSITYNRNNNNDYYYNTINGNVSAVISQNSLSAVLSSTLNSTCQLNTESSSVVVHPSMSDQGSILSEVDSYRFAESVADGLGDENNPNSNNNACPNETSSNNREKLSKSTVKSTVTEMQALKLKIQEYLIKAFLCAMCAIKKISVNQSSTIPNIDHQHPIVVSMPSRNVRGKHHYHMQPNHRGNSTNHLQRRRATHNDSFNTGLPTGSIRNTESSDPNNSATCLPTENLPYFLRPGASSPCGSNQIREQSSVGSGFNMSSSTTSKSFNGHILWTLDVAISLGPSAVCDYCDVVLQCVRCPLLMHKITSKVIAYFRRRITTQMTDVVGSRGVTIIPQFDQHGNFSTALSCEVISEAVDKNMNFCPVVSQNFWSMNPNIANPQDGIPVIAVPFSNLDPNNMTSSFNYRTFLPTSIHSPITPWSHSTGSVNYPVLQPTLYSKQFHENICQFEQMNLNSELNINSTSYASVNKPNISGAALNQSPYYHQSSGGNPWTMTAQPYVHHLQKPCIFKFIFGISVVEKLINQTHILFHSYISQRLQYIGQSQAEWDEFVDLILKAHSVHLTMPAINRNLHWDNLLTYIRRHPKCSPALWQRILAGIQTADLKRSA